MPPVGLYAVAKKKSKATCIVNLLSIHALRGTRWLAERRVVGFAKQLPSHTSATTLGAPLLNLIFHSILVSYVIIMSIFGISVKFYV